MPTLNDIVDSEVEEDDKKYLPALLAVPEEELTDDEEDFNLEDNLSATKQFKRDSSPLSEVPTAMNTPIVRNVLTMDLSPLSTTPSTALQTPTMILGNSFLSLSPMYTPRAESKFLTERATQRRLETVRNLRETAAAKKALEDAAKARQLEDNVEKMKSYFDEMPGSLEQRGYSLADFMEYVFNPATR
ncbi:hypothetical protein DFH08DRAFT_956744 [Mycena albidolilacea]|uniref:Uncharacterized protein n=1 Tax=Mycena albidolilacea TaxID=1033008 RepID=A0AAD7AC50_9AGAR|nr:hypothetical protein DFH08DRAFT_956744 [Mycena albidolilacea]